MSNKQNNDSSLNINQLDDEVVRQFILNYLKQNPDFWTKHPETWINHQVPEREFSVSNVADFQVSMIGALKERLRETSQTLHAITELGRDNSLSFKRVEQAVCLLLSSHDIYSFDDIIHFKIPQILNIEAIRLILCGDIYEDIRKKCDSLNIICMDHICFLNNHNLKPKQMIRLRSKICDSQKIYDPLAGVIVSDAWLQQSININREKSTVVMPFYILFGSRQENLFEPEQATDLLEFLAKSIAITTARILNSPQL